LLPFTAEQVPLALLIAEQLRAHNLASEIIYSESSVTNLMKKANKLGAKYALLLGPDEQAQHTISVKNLVTGQSNNIPQSQLTTFLKG